MHCPAPSHSPLPARSLALEGAWPFCWGRIQCAPVLGAGKGISTAIVAELQYECVSHERRHGLVDQAADLDLQLPILGEYYSGAVQQIRVVVRIRSYSRIVLVQEVAHIFDMHPIALARDENLNSIHQTLQDVVVGCGPRRVT